MSYPLQHVGICWCLSCLLDECSAGSWWLEYRVARCLIPPAINPDSIDEASLEGGENKSPVFSPDMPVVWLSSVWSNTR